MKMSSFYICVPKIAIIWWMLLEIWVQHTFFCHFGSFFALLPHYWPQKLETEKNKRRYFLFHRCTTNKDSWNIRCKIIWCMLSEIWSSTGKIFSHFGPFFALLLKNKNFEWKKPGEFISLYLCTTNDNHMMYGSLDIRCNKQSFLWTIICLLWHPPPKKTKALKNQDFDKMKQKKNSWGYYHLYQKHINENHIMYGSCDMECDRQFFLTLNRFLPFHSHTNMENHNFDKMKKATRDITILYMCTINENHMMYVSWDIKHARTFRRFGPSFVLLPH